MILCSECHDVFDAMLCCVVKVVVEYDDGASSGSTAVVYKLAVADALKCVQSRVLREMDKIGRLLS
jgi:hypothetical protein